MRTQLQAAVTKLAQLTNTFQLLKLGVRMISLPTLTGYLDWQSRARATLWRQPGYSQTVIVCLICVKVAFRTYFWFLCTTRASFDPPNRSRNLLLGKIAGTNKYAWIGGTGGASGSAAHRWLSDRTVLNTALAVDGQLDPSFPNMCLHLFWLGSYGKRIGDAPGSDHRFASVCEAAPRGEHSILLSIHVLN